MIRAAKKSLARLICTNYSYAVYTIVSPVSLLLIKNVIANRLLDKTQTNLLRYCNENSCIIWYGHFASDIALNHSGGKTMN